MIIVVLNFRDIVGEVILCTKVTAEIWLWVNSVMQTEFDFTKVWIFADQP